jgi:hypothetical protein
LAESGDVGLIDMTFDDDVSGLPQLLAQVTDDPVLGSLNVQLQQIYPFSEIIRKIDCRD